MCVCVDTANVISICEHLCESLFKLKAFLILQEKKTIIYLLMFHKLQSRNIPCEKRPPN